MIPSRGAIRVLFIDDSQATRQLCGDRLAREADIHIIGILPDPLMALHKIRSDNPDVIVVDIEMPRANGVQIINQIMQAHPRPVVVYCSQTGRYADLGLKAMAAGAIAIVKKPQTTLLSSLQSAGLALAAAIREAAKARLVQARAASPNSQAMTAQSLIRAATNVPTPSNDGLRSKQSADAMMPASPAQKAAPGGERLIAIGASTGGTQALEVILTRLPALLPGIVIVQHMPEKFTTMFAARLDTLCKLTVKEAANGDKVRPGVVLIAPGGRHMMIKRSGSGYHVEVADGPLVNRHKPSVDLMFRSVAQAAGASATGFILTGMGDDGARGLREMHDAGARTVAQDEPSCVVFGMPKVAIAMGGVDKIISLEKIHSEIIAST